MENEEIMAIKNYSVEEAKEIIFKTITKINSSSVLIFTKKAFEHSDALFWLSPCSSSGKYHPPEDQGDGGLIRHLIKAVAITEEFARRDNFTQYERDLAISATLLHDIKKNGNPWGKVTDYRHGIIGAEFLDKFELYGDITGKNIILDAVRYHMAPWNTRGLEIVHDALDENQVKLEIEEKIRGSRPHSIIEKCVQEADYWASRQSMSFFPGKEIILDSK